VNDGGALGKRRRIQGEKKEKKRGTVPTYGKTPKSKKERTTDLSEEFILLLRGPPRQIFFFERETD